MKTLIFDMDGTIIDSGQIIADTINHVRFNIGLDELEKDELLHNVNNPDIHPPMYFYEVESYSKLHIDLFENFYHANFMDKIQLYDGVVDLLEQFCGDFRFAIATNAHTSVANKMLEHLKISHFFEKIIGADDVENAKPHPDMILKILNDLKIGKHEAILIGDSHKDILAAKNAQIDSILVNWGFTRHSDGALCSMEELTEYLNKLLD
jgi:phosphoglycolate phosphatase